MNESQYINLQKKQWRSITFNWDILSQNDNTQGKLYCLTDFQTAWLLSVTEYFRWSSRWENCPCTQADMDALKAEMEYNLMTCLDFQSWQLQAIYDNQTAQELAQFNSAWNGTEPSSVNANAPDDYFNGDDSADRNNALCTALTLWTYSYCVEWSSKASIVLGIANAVTEFVAGVVGAGGIISTLAITDLIAPLNDQFDAMQNINAVNTVICDWIDGLYEVAITPANWTSAISGLSYTAETNEWYIQQLITSDSALLSNFLAFVNSLGDAYVLAQLGIYICPCDCLVTEVYDFTADGYTSIWFPRTDFGTTTYIAGVGWQGTQLNGIGCQIFTSRYSRVTAISGTIVLVGGTGSVFRADDRTEPISGTVIGSIPFSGDHTMVYDLMIVASRTGGTYTATIQNLTITGCLA